MTNQMHEMAVELAHRMHIRVHPELLGQYLNFRYSVWKNASNRERAKKGLLPHEVMPAEKLVEWVKRYQIEFNDGAQA